jgi:hypothetical protein
MQEVPLNTQGFSSLTLWQVTFKLPKDTIRVSLFPPAITHHLCHFWSKGQEKERNKQTEHLVWSVPKRHQKLTVLSKAKICLLMCALYKAWKQENVWVIFILHAAHWRWMYRYIHTHERINIIYSRYDILSRNFQDSITWKDTHCTTMTHHYDWLKFLYQLGLPPHHFVTHCPLDPVLFCPILWCYVCPLAIFVCSQLLYAHTYNRRATPKIHYLHYYKTLTKVKFHSMVFALQVFFYPLKPTGNYMYHLLQQSVTRHFAHCCVAPGNQTGNLTVTVSQSKVGRLIKWHNRAGLAKIVQNRRGRVSHAELIKFYVYNDLEIRLRGKNLTNCHTAGRRINGIVKGKETSWHYAARLFFDGVIKYSLAGNGDRMVLMGWSKGRS